jgi:hypothetical protein
MFIILPPAPPHLLSTVFDSCTIEGGRQTLDRAEWRNVTFLNMKIFYKGGNVVLKNVKFINCTFSFVRDNYARQVLNYAALDQSSLHLGMNTSLGTIIGLNGQ